ncbi:outer membrane protein assembly factor BamA [Candidatus Poribacteria bacterium]|jgi:outer membrane protein insertion porin family|nr:outer membrane protein assembly factor BamA [Candidatus Poribacteria bacterium]MBT5710857.1 outer membrane protein assembly factor BamA [Candidatus Poribacteria bacterium]MBT7806911.1 outer membrane protein assembly factor BamA [Candidatus Poribacteria bacterium]
MHPMSRLRFAACALAFFLSTVLSAAIAQEATSEAAGGAEQTPAAVDAPAGPGPDAADADLVVTGIHVTGSENVDSLIEGLFAQSGYFGTRVGDEVSLQALSSDVRRVYMDYGPFADVQVDVSPADEGGLVVTFRLTEYPRVQGDVEVVGNSRLSYKKLKKLFTLRDGERFSEYELWNTARAVEEKYRDEGFYFAAVTTHTEATTNELGDPAILARIEVAEGERMKVAEVRFEGNALVLSEDLEDACQIREGKRFRDDLYEQDPLRIRAHYNDEGCLNAKVVASRREVSEDGAGLVVTYVVDEGPQFVFDGYTVDFGGVDSQVSEGKIRGELDLRPGDVFNATQYRDDVLRVDELYKNRGNILVDIVDTLQPDTSAESVGATLSIREGSTITVGEIDVQGLSKTKEYIIRRELERMGIAPGEPMLASNLQKAEQNIIQLGSFIQGLRFMPRGTDVDDRKDLVVELRENVRTGLFTIGGGYGSESGVFGVAEIGDGNLLGRAYRVNVRGELGQRARRVGQVSFATPWVLGTPTSLRAQLYSINQRRFLYSYAGAITADDSYEDFRRGFSISLGTPISRDISTFVTFRDEQVEANFIPLVEGADDDLNSFLVGARETRSITAGLSRDTRRYRTSLFDPMAGGEDTVSFEHSGGLLGGRNAFRKYSVESSRFFQSWWKFVLALHAQAGYLQDRSGINPTFLFYERYWLGGIDTIRGYPDFSLIPSRAGDVAVGDDTVAITPRIGGNRMFFLNAEYRIPINPMIRGLAFVDVGQVWNEATTSIRKDFDPIVSVGVGLRLELVAGFLIRMEYGIPLTSVPVFDTATGAVERRSFNPRLHFSMGPSF